MKRTVVLVTLLATLFAACGGDESVGSAEDPAGVAEAAEAEGEAVVSGYLFVLDDGTVVLAEAQAESFPPQPGGETINVEGLDLDSVDLEQPPEGSEIATSQWSTEQVTLTGSMMSGVLEEAELG